MIIEEFSDEQVAVFQKFIRAGFDINDVKSPQLNEKQLQELYLGKKAGIDISAFCTPEITIEELKAMRQNYAIVFEYYNQNQIIQIFDAAKHGVNFKKILNHELDHLQMRQIKLGERYGIETSVYALPNFNAEQMLRLRAELIVRKVIETIKESFNERWKKILEWARCEEPPAEDLTDLNDIIAKSRTNGIIETYIFNAELAVIASKVYEQVSVMLLENEKELKDETVFQIKEAAEKISNQLINRI